MYFLKMCFTAAVNLLMWKEMPLIEIPLGAKDACQNFLFRNTLENWDESRSNQEIAS